MFFLWNIKKLKEELIHNGLSQKSLFIYILIYMLIAQFFSETTFFPSLEQTAKPTDYIQGTIDLLVVGLGTYLCFRVNGASAGSHFAERYFSISFVVGLRFLVLLVPALFLFGFGMEMLQKLGAVETNEAMVDYATVVLVSSLLILTYARIIKHIRDVAMAAHI